jgi:hypothetical protein
MQVNQIKRIVAQLAAIIVIGSLGLTTAIAAEPPSSYHAARWDPIHFQPKIATASNEECLSCHQNVIEDTPKDKSSAGVERSQSLAWYQTLDTYQGEQDTFHRRHLVTDLAKELMQMRCTTCHQGNDPREEVSGSSATAPEGLTMRKMVDPNICLMCHGQMNVAAMGLPKPWPESREMFQNNCTLCHNNIRTNRHQVNFLNAEAIETAGKTDSDVCYGCHGGRSWYRTVYPYPRHAWTGMSSVVPEWAKDRPTESNPRFVEKP